MARQPGTLGAHPVLEVGEERRTLHAAHREAVPSKPSRKRSACSPPRSGGSEVRDPLIAFDSNVLLRLLLNDDARQARVAQALLDHAVSRSDKVLLPDIVLCELEWVLDSVYEVPKAESIGTLRRLLDAEEFAFLDRAAVAGSLNACEVGSADFSDYLIGTSAARAGAATTYTFDRALRRADGFTLPR